MFSVSPLEILVMAKQHFYPFFPLPHDPHDGIQRVCIDPQLIALLLLGWGKKNNPIISIAWEEISRYIINNEYSWRAASLFHQAFTVYIYIYFSSSAR